MAYDHKLLSDAELGPLAAKMVGEAAPPKMRRLVAQGAAPLPPRDMLVALYQVWVVGDELSEVAAKTVTNLPDPTLRGAIASPNLHPGALDLLGRKLIRRAELLDAVVRHTNTDDESIVGIARICAELVCETIARAEARWLRKPEIVASLYQNRHCRMSLIHRILEMAKREGVEIQMAGMEEVQAALAEDAEAGAVFDQSTDAEFSTAIGVDVRQGSLLDEFLGAGVEDDLSLPTLDTLDFDTDDEPAQEAGAVEEEPEEEAKYVDRATELMKMRPSEKVRAALLGNKSDRNILVRDSNRVVAMAAIKSPKVSDGEICAWSSNRSLSPEVIRFIANRREWVKMYAVKLNLVNNPKTPMAKAMTLLAYISRQDLAKVSRSKSVPSALAKAAKRKLGR